LALAGRAPSPSGRSAAGALATAGQGLPRFYVTLSSPGQSGQIIAEVHASQTGRVLSQADAGFVGNGISISADQSDRAFVIAAAASDNVKNDEVVLYRLLVSASGSSVAVSRLPLVLLPLNSPDIVDGIAVSPDGTKLAVALQVNANPNAADPRGEIVVYSLTGGVTQTWTAAGDKAVPWDPAWAGGSRFLTFVWQDQLTGSQWFFTGRSEVRRLDTAAQGRNLLASQVLVTGGGQTGFIQSASAGRGDSPIIAAVFQVPSIGGSGTARMRLVALSAATGAITQVFARHDVAYSGQQQEGTAVASCQVLGSDPTGQHTLVYCPGFGRIDNGVLTPLAHISAVFAAAW
jgi:hypothetical protein